MVRKRIYTHVSEDAVKGFLRLSACKHVYVTPASNGEFTVVTIDGRRRKRPLLPPSRLLFRDFSVCA
jgi:hypothetical protein